MLVIAPLNTVLNWKDEVEKWTSKLDIDIDVSIYVYSVTVALYQCLWHFINIIDVVTVTADLTL